MSRSMIVLSYSFGLAFMLIGCGGGYISVPGAGGSSSGGGSGESNPSNGTVTISSISPASVPAGIGDLTIVVAGSNLDLVHSGSHQTVTNAVWSVSGSNSALTTTVLSGTQLAAVIPAALTANAVTAQVFVQKWYWADDTPFTTSNSLTFTVTVATSSTTGSMAVARSSHSATLLPNGMVLIAGGSNTSGTLNTAELFDPAKGTFTATGNLQSPHQGHTATLLSSGKVLIAGGDDNVGPVAAAEVYDPASGTFTSVGNMTSVRESHTATLLVNGKVLITGGVNNTDVLDSAELFDPNSNTFMPVPNMTSPRTHHTAIALANGKVLLAGGWSSQAPITTLASAELFDPDTNSFTAVGNMSSPHCFHRSILLPDGRVLVIGGNTGMFSTEVIEDFDPASNSFAVAGFLLKPRTSHTATLLPRGTVLVTGGSYDFPGPDAPESVVLKSTEVYSPGSSRAVNAPPLTIPRVGHTATLLNDGRVLIIGGTGSNGNALAAAEISEVSQ